jgi:hypothetical protein
MADNLFDSITFGDARRAMEVWTDIFDNVVQHALVFLADDTHDCGEPDFTDDETDPLSPEAARAYFAFESSALSLFHFARAGMRHDGDPVQTLTDHVNDLYADMDTRL